MDNYIHKIIHFFFHHEVSDDIATRVYSRMVSPTKDKAGEEAVARIWDELDEVSCSEEKVEEAFQKLESSLGYEKAIDAVGITGPDDKVRKRIDWIRIAAVWAIPLIMLCCSAYYYFAAKDYVRATLSEVTYIQHYAAMGSHEEVTLPDGTKVWLNAGTLLVYPSIFKSDSRNVYLAGEGFFEVTKDKEHPFIVTTNYLKMKVLGTTFNVLAYPDNHQVMTTLETGKLQVTVNGRPDEYLLAPDDQLIYTPSTGEVQQCKVHAGSHSDWRMGGLFFSNVPFNDVLHTLERVYGVEFHVRTSIYQNHKLRVHFNRNESLERVLQIIKILIPGIEYEIAGKNIYLE